jgi:DNA-binding MarR family transcriptional regulator
MNAVASSAAIGCSGSYGKEDGILMFAFPNTIVSYGRWISQRDLPMPTMPQANSLSELEERILLTIWKLKGIGKNGVAESNLQTELPNETPQNLAGAIEALQNQGFVERRSSADRTFLSLTPLGLAILRKLEEDRLQELK